MISLGPFPGGAVGSLPADGRQIAEAPFASSAGAPPPPGPDGVQIADDGSFLVDDAGNYIAFA